MRRTSSSESLAARASLQPASLRSSACTRRRKLVNLTESFLSAAIIAADKPQSWQIDPCCFLKLFEIRHPGERMLAQRPPNSRSRTQKAGEAFRPVKVNHCHLCWFGRVWRTLAAWQGIGDEENGRRWLPPHRSAALLSSSWKRKEAFTMKCEKQESG